MASARLHVFGRAAAARALLQPGDTFLHRIYGTPLAGRLRPTTRRRLTDGRRPSEGTWWVARALAGYRAVVVEADPQCRMSKEWIQQNVSVDSLAGPHQPYYHALVDVRDTARPRTNYGTPWPTALRTTPPAPELTAEAADSASGGGGLPQWPTRTSSRTCRWSRCSTRTRSGCWAASSTARTLPRGTRGPARRTCRRRSRRSRRRCPEALPRARISSPQFSAHGDWQGSGGWAVFCNIPGRDKFAQKLITATVHYILHYHHARCKPWPMKGKK